MNGTDYYINNKHMKEFNKIERENYFFGIFFGTALIFIGLEKILTTHSIYIDIICVAFAFLGIMNVLAAIIYPNCLTLIKKVLSYFIQILAKIVFGIVLIIIYVLLVIPVGFFLKKKKIKNKNSNFVDYNYENEIININRNSFIYHVLRIFKFFINEKTIVFIPILILLIIIAMIIVLAQSSFVAPFIYTLF